MVKVVLLVLSLGLLVSGNVVPSEESRVISSLLQEIRINPAMLLQRVQSSEENTEKRAFVRDLIEKKHNAAAAKEFIEQKRHYVREILNAKAASADASIEVKPIIKELLQVRAASADANLKVKPIISDLLKAKAAAADASIEVKPLINELLRKRRDTTNVKPFIEDLIMTHMNIPLKVNPNILLNQPKTAEHVFNDLPKVAPQSLLENPEAKKDTFAEVPQVAEQNFAEVPKVNPLILLEPVTLGRPVLVQRLLEDLGNPVTFNIQPDGGNPGNKVIVPVVREQNQVDMPVVRETNLIDAPVVRENVLVNVPVVNEMNHVQLPVVREQNLINMPQVRYDSYGGLLSDVAVPQHFNIVPDEDEEVTTITPPISETTGLPTTTEEIILTPYE